MTTAICLYPADLGTDQFSADWIRLCEKIGLGTVNNPPANILIIPVSVTGAINE